MGSDKKVKKVSLSLQVKFLQRFTALIENGFAIVDALEVMGTFMDSKMIDLVKEGCAEGKPFSSILETLRFQAQIVYLIKASEQHNALIRGLVRARDYSQNYFKTRTEVTKKMRYPLFLFGIVMLVLTVVFLFFIPRLDAFYATFGVDHDQTAVGGMMMVLLVMLFGLTGLMVMILFVLKFQQMKFQIWLRGKIFRIPGLKKLTSRLFSYYFATQIEMFIGCGLSFKDSLATIQAFDTLPLVKLIAKEIEKDALSGASLEMLFQNRDCFTPYFKLIAIHSLRIGKLDEELKSFVSMELTSLNGSITGFIKGIQGGLLASVGVLIALLYLSILQPVFNLIAVI
ncbi:MAG: type II secretion system F family protein [Defluviitaleaceae bacterium]|nr:type II secretion system F family protein [Defluviitaleaceae bacterium]